MPIRILGYLTTAKTSSLDLFPNAGSPFIKRDSLSADHR